jgi:long-chain acyl-CoA synthetase
MVPQLVFDVPRTLQLIAAERITVLPGAPTLFTSLLDHPDRPGHDLSSLRLAVTGATTVPPAVVERMRTELGFETVLTGYGLTEAVVATMCRPGDPDETVAHTCGRAAAGMQVRIGAGGEVLLRGPNVMLGYLDDKAATDEAVDAEGWLHTGDVGEMVDGTHLRIVDRLKDIVITAGGKNVSPSEIENALKFSPYIKEAVVIGDRRPYLVALIGIELDTVGDWAQRNGLPYTTYRDLSEKPEVLRLIQGIISASNESFSPPEQIKKFRMIVKELDHEDGELTATQKVKRSAIGSLLGHLVDDMYSNATAYPGGDMSAVHTESAAPPAAEVPA